MKKLTTFILIVLCAATLFAQAPEKFTYQAVVRNASNSLIANGQVGMRVSILQGSANGSAVYVETQTATTNANGLMTLSIGGGTVQQGTFANIDWANGPFFLKTETDPNGGSNYSVTSTQQLLSVPYALYAKTAENGFSGDYNDLTNKPQNVSAFTNDAGYITTAQIPTNVSTFTNDAEYITNAQLTALLAALNDRIDSLQTLLNMVAPENIDVMSCPEAPTLTDVEGNVYRTVKIGNQCWMRDNLRTAHYSDGTIVPENTSGTHSYTVPFFYDHIISTIPLEQRGYFYNWTCMMHGATSSNAVPSGVQGVCPAGWHVPSRAEWENLFEYLSTHAQYICGSDTENFAKALASNTLWQNSTDHACDVGNNQSTNNASGFEAIPAGAVINGDFEYSGYVEFQTAVFWSSTDDGGSNAYGRKIGYDIPHLHWGINHGKDDGFSVRCVRD